MQLSVARQLRPLRRLVRRQHRRLCVVDYDPTLLSNAAKYQADVCMKALRRAGHPLLNKNCAVDANESRRLANKRWRDSHPGYMAQKSREARQRRRLALEAEEMDAN